MATSKKGQVTLRGRFSAGSEVRLVKVRDESVLRSEGGKTVATETVDDSGTVQFKSGVEVGARYLVVGLVGGVPLEVRARGRAADDDSEVLAQAPVTPDRTRLADGSWSDEAPEPEKAGFAGVGPGPGQHQVPDGTPQRSDTLRGSAHPVDPDEDAPYPRQEDVAGDVAQRSDTATGIATPIAADVPVSQSEVRKGTLQRSDTPLGYATPIPKGDAVAAQQQREAADTKASVGEPVKAAALPPDFKPGKRRGDQDPAVVRTAETADLVAAVPPEQVDSPGDIDTTADTSGLDPQGQPLADDVAAAAGVEPASKPAAARTRSRSSSSKSGASKPRSATKRSGSGSRSK